MTQQPKHPHNRKRTHPNWGGRRPGAGAPKGNMNALKHGRRSRQLARLSAAVAANPKIRETLLAIGDRWEAKQMAANEVAAYIFGQMIERGLKRGDARRGQPPLIVLPPTVDGPSIEMDGPTQTGEKENHGPINQEPNATRPHRSRSVWEKPVDRMSKPPH